MQKYLKEIKERSSEDWQALVAYMSTTHGDTFCTLSWGELLKVSNYCSEYQFSLDFQKLMRKLEVPPLEESLINSMINCTKESRVEAKQKLHHAASERTKRLIENWRHNLSVEREIEKLAATRKTPRVADIKADFDKLASDIL